MIRIPDETHLVEFGEPKSRREVFAVILVQLVFGSLAELFKGRTFPARHVDELAGGHVEILGFRHLYTPVRLEYVLQVLIFSGNEIEQCWRNFGAIFMRAQLTGQGED